jgi:monovalent cation:H+ antiporter-2, CPA2 family
MHDLSHLPVILILLAAAVVIVALFRKLHASPVLGYLAAGAIIGPSGSGLISNVDTIGAIAEFGVVFLLFIIGLELSWERLRTLRRQIFTLGMLQLILTAGILAAGMAVSGMPGEAAFIAGGGLALSSTALVLQLIEEHQQKASQLGRLSLAVLLAQDLGVIPLLVLVPVLAHSQGGVSTDLINVTVKAASALVIIVLIGRLLLKPLYRAIASLGNPEIFTAFTLLVALGTGWLTSQAGLSLTLGAFLAGILVAETEYRHQVEADVMPYKGLFLGLFFMAVGMSANLAIGWQAFPLIVSLAILLMTVKSLIVFVLCRALGYRIGSSLQTGLMLSQGGEFAFVLFTLAEANGFIPLQTAQLLILVVTASMVLTPFAAMLGRMLAFRIDPLRGQSAEDSLIEMTDLSDHVIILGFGRVGQTVAKLLSAENRLYIALDTQVGLVSTARTIGLPVYYGDGSRREVLQAIGVDRASAAIVTVNDPEAGRRAVRALRTASSTLPIIARAVDLEGVLGLEGAGANIAVSERFEASLQLGGALLESLGVDEHEIHRIIQLFRSRDYALARGTLEVSPELHHTPYGKMLAFQKVATTEAVVKE